MSKTGDAPSEGGPFEAARRCIRENDLAGARVLLGLDTDFPEGDLVDAITSYMEAKSALASARYSEAAESMSVARELLTPTSKIDIADGLELTQKIAEASASLVSADGQRAYDTLLPLGKQLASLSERTGDPDSRDMALLVQIQAAAALARTRINQIDYDGADQALADAATYAARLGEQTEDEDFLAIAEFVIPALKVERGSAFGLVALYRYDFARMQDELDAADDAATVLEDFERFPAPLDDFGHMALVNHQVTRGLHAMAAQGLLKRGDLDASARQSIASLPKLFAEAREVSGRLGDLGLMMRRQVDFLDEVRRNLADLAYTAKHEDSRVTFGRYSGLVTATTFLVLLVILTILGAVTGPALVGFSVVVLAVAIIAGFGPRAPMFNDTLKTLLRLRDPANGAAPSN